VSTPPYNADDRPTLFIKVEVTGRGTCNVIEMNGHGCPWNVFTVALDPNSERTQRIVRRAAGSRERYEWAMAIIERAYTESRASSSTTVTTDSGQQA
jgi:hypothetical protein